MSAENRYDHRSAESRWQQVWREQSIYDHETDSAKPVYSIDTPPPTVSGSLHIGHVFSYTHADAIARYRRMRGYKVIYPMGFDDNGLPTERFVEREHGIRATDLSRDDFMKVCLETVATKEREFEDLWCQLGLSVNWKLHYSTISPTAQRISQSSFLALFEAGRVYRKESPTLWCPRCQTAIAQAELEDEEIDSAYVDVLFKTSAGKPLKVSTTRPELLPACVALFAHPSDERFRALVGQRVQSPLGAEDLPLLSDARVDPGKGTGLVMCCTFGDTTDIAWWSDYGLPLKAILTRDGKLNGQAGPNAGLTLEQARGRIISDLTNRGLLTNRRAIRHIVNVHERCGTPVEFMVTPQWFIRLLDMKEKLIKAGRSIDWTPNVMRTRYESWVENLKWDWCISRQRPYGVPIPLWTCTNCGRERLARRDELPVDPVKQEPDDACPCGARDYQPERDVMDTWATSSLTPQIVADCLRSSGAANSDLSPMDLRPQAHDIIRTWAFYTIAQSLLHDQRIPWRAVMISGHAQIAGEKISKSKGPSSNDPFDLIEQHSADAIRYWACSTRPGRDTVYDENTVSEGRRLITKLWNAVRFGSMHLESWDGREEPLQLIDRWLLHHLSRAIAEASRHFEIHDYCGAKDFTERFFWKVLCDHYLEWVKDRLYSKTDTQARAGAQYALYHGLLSTLKLLAPVMPFITEELYQLAFRAREGFHSIHRAPWPETFAKWEDKEAQRAGDLAMDVLDAVRKEKSARKMSLAAPLSELTIECEERLVPLLESLLQDLKVVTRAQEIRVLPRATVGVSTRVSV